MNTMKISLATALSLFALACGTTDDVPQPPPVKPADSAQATQPPAPPQKRTLLDGTQLASSPVNLLIDPAFGLEIANYGQAGYGMWIDEAAQQTGFTTTLDSRSPAGFGGAVGLFQADGATNTQSDELVFIAPFPGGGGPFRARAWVSKSDVNGKPVTFTTDVKSIQLSLAAATPSGDAVDLTAVSGATRSYAGRTWVMLEVNVAQPYPYGGYFIIHTGTKGGRWHIAAPEVVAQPLVQGLPTQSLDLGKTVTRPKTAKEQRTIDAYRKLQPKLVPAASNIHKRSVPPR